MFKLRLICWSSCLVFYLLAGGRAEAQGQPLYYSASSSLLSQNTLDSVATNGSGNNTLLTATGSGNQIYRCTALAVDEFNGNLFLLDGMAGAIWSMNIGGGGLTLVESGLTNYPMDLALDVVNQKIYYTTSSTLQNNNTVQRVDYSGSNNAVLFTASGPSNNGGNGVSRCTAIAVDTTNSEIFIADAGAHEIWSMGMDGSNLKSLATNTSAFPTDLALDVANEQVYFTASSTVQGANTIQRVNYDGSGLVTTFTASGSVERCTALDYDPTQSTVYLSDAAANTIWRIPNGGSAGTVVNGLVAVAKKVRFYSGPQMPPPPPPPELLSISLSGTTLFLLVTNVSLGHSFDVLTATNLTQPLNQWLPLFTNLQETAGNSLLLAPGAFNPGPGQQYFILRVP